MTGLLLAGAAGGTRTADARSDALGGAGWPQKPVTWVVPYPAGGGSDAFARPIAAAVGDRLGQTMVIDNRSGAGGTIGTALVARAPADGYTLLVGDTGLTYAPIVYPKAGFDFGRDFAPVSALARVPYVLLINPERLPVSDLAGFIEAAKKHPGDIDIGSAGLGTVIHLAIGMFEQRADIKLHHVPYRGGAPMLQDLLAGQIAAAFVVLNAAAGLVASGRLRALAVASRRREALLPDVPTMQEAGLANFRVPIWFGLFAPKRTPEAILDRLHGAVQAALAEEKTKRLWAELGARVELESRADFTRFVSADAARWIDIARSTNIQLE
jgi:tripartite-type tricarboxylate transporter receptor subunit TctC